MSGWGGPAASPPSPAAFCHGRGAGAGGAGAVGELVPPRLPRVATRAVVYLSNEHVFPDRRALPKR
jgi:hypothetical protein